MLKDTKKEKKKKELKMNQFLPFFLSETFSSRSPSPALMQLALGTVTFQPSPRSPPLPGGSATPGEERCSPPAGFLHPSTIPLINH